MAPKANHTSGGGATGDVALGTTTTANTGSTTTASADLVGSNNNHNNGVHVSTSGDDIPVQAVAMKLLDVRLKPGSAIITSASGEFTAPGSHELVCVKAGGVVEIHKIVQESLSSDDNDNDEQNTTTTTTRTLLKLMAKVETHSIVRSCSVLRFPGEKRDVVALGADGGALSVLDFEQPAAGANAGGGAGGCKIIHCVIFGKTGCRRATPGQYVATDPKGRAVMVCAIEKRKLVYVLNRDAAGTPTIASPLEAHRTRTLTVDVIGLDNGYDNPIFAAIELQYPDTEDNNNNHAGLSVMSGGVAAMDAVEKQLAYYELDLGLNHVSRRWATTIHGTACCLAAIPGGADGPGGVLVGCEDWIEYMHENSISNTIRGGVDGSEKTNGKTFPRIVCAVPRRRLHPTSKGVLITRITVHRQKKAKFFALAQSELGDVYKVSLQLDDPDKSKVTGMDVALLDTLPVANALNVSRLGMLFAAAEFGDHILYQFERIDLPDAPSSTSEETRNAFFESEEKVPAAFLTTEAAARLAPTFDPTVLRNLRKVFAMDNPSPTSSVMVGELAGNEVSPQIYTLTGRGPHSALRIMRHGASITELAVSDLPGVPGGIFTIADNNTTAERKAGSMKRTDRYIVVSFADATLVLSIGDTIEEVGKESGFLTNAPTLACSALGDDGALCQVHPSGVRQIQKGQAKQWHCPGLKRIECGSTNESQVLIALAGGELIYFELDPMSGNLIERATRDIGADVCCLDVGTIASGRSRSLFAAVGCRDQTVRIVSLEPGNLLLQRSSTALKSRPHSVALQTMTGTDGRSNNAPGGDEISLVIGLDDGSALRVNVDSVTGSIGTSPTRRFLGARAVSVSKIRLELQSAYLLLSSRPWISRKDATSGKFVMAPLSYAPLDYGSSFSSGAIHEGIVATAGKTLRILSVDSAGMSGDDESFNVNKVELRYTPRQMTLISAGTATESEKRKVVLVVVESDNNDYGLEEKKAMGFDSSGEGKLGTKGKGDDDAMDMDEDSDEEDKKQDNKDDDDDAEEREAHRTSIRGPVPPSQGFWGSCVRLLDPSNSCWTLDCVEMGRNEAALCCASVRFHSKGGEPLLAVGTVTGMTMHPLKHSASHIILYRIVNGERLQLLHRTTIDDGPVLALAHFQGRLLAGIGTSLRLFEMGKRQLLRKSERRGLPTFVKTIQTVGDRAFVGDMMQSIQIFRFDAASNRFVMVAVDPSPRPIVSQELLDWNTLAVGDKFGNISVLRMPRGANHGAVDVTGQRALWDSSRDDACPRLELLCQYYVGEVVTGLTRSSLVAGGAECLIYVTVTGRIGALIPFTSRGEVEFYTQLEAALRVEAPRPTGRDPQSYRSYYAPIMHVVDGDLCDAFNSLSHEKQAKIAEGLGYSIGEVMKKLEDTRNVLL